MKKRDVLSLTPFSEKSPMTRGFLRPRGAGADICLSIAAVKAAGSPQPRAPPDSFSPALRASDTLMSLTQVAEKETRTYIFCKMGKRLYET